MIVVVGAGCFGAWTAYELARSGRQVTLIDAFGPGNTRSSSGGETRIMRTGYGARAIYSGWAVRSLEAWQRLLSARHARLFQETGVLWIAREGDPLTTATRETLEAVGVPHEVFGRAALTRRWPQIEFGDDAWAIHEPHGGVLLARRAVDAVVEAAVAAGARFEIAAASAPALNQSAANVTAGGRRLESLSTTSGARIAGEAFVFACGPWLPKLFPEALADRIFVTRQCVFYLAPPPGDSRFAPPAMPAWIDFGAEVYGVPDLESRGFKIAFDRHGPPFDPDTGDRGARQVPEALRATIDARFPALRGAPLLSSEVCQYENTSSGDFLIDRHPDFENVYFVGGGSGHGFKHGPAVGEAAARLVTCAGEPDECFRLATKERTQQRAVF